MAKLKVVVFLSTKLRAAVDNLAKRYALSRSEVMRRCMQLGIEPLRQQLESGQAGPREASSRSTPRSSRPSGRSGRKLWRYPDWDIEDATEDLCEDLLDENRDLDREQLRDRLRASGIAAEAKDPSETIDRVLRKILGVPGREYLPVPESDELP